MTTPHNRRGDELGKPETCRRCGVALKRGSKRYCGRACYGEGAVQDFEQRFWSKVAKGPACWLWTGSRDHFGYGQISIRLAPGRHQPRRAHVISYELAHGTTGGQWVLHTCDTPHCVNPGHLYLGDHKKNMEDAQARGRLHAPRPTAQRLSPEQIDMIRSRVTAGEMRYRVAADFGISKAYVTRIMQGTARQYDAPLTPSLEQAS